MRPLHQNCALLPKGAQCFGLVGQYRQITRIRFRVLRFQTLGNSRVSTGNKNPEPSKILCRHHQKQSPGGSGGWMQTQEQQGRASTCGAISFSVSLPWSRHRHQGPAAEQTIQFLLWVAVKTAGLCQCVACTGGESSRSAHTATLVLRRAVCGNCCCCCS